MKIKAVVQGVERNQYGRLTVRLAMGATAHTLTIDNTQATARAYTVGRVVEIIVKPKGA
jgi:hypothetical protein